MKTAISIPDTTFERASAMAMALGLSRSEFITRAVSRYLDALESDDAIEEINATLDALAQPDTSNSDAAFVGRRFLGSGEADW